MLQKEIVKVSEDSSDKVSTDDDGTTNGDNIKIQVEPTGNAYRNTDGTYKQQYHQILWNQI